jgi:hypothetical protein
MVFLDPRPMTMDQLLIKLRQAYDGLPVESIRACFDGLRVNINSILIKVY